MNPADAETLVREHYAMVYRYIRSIRRPGAPVEDLVQQVFLIALDKLQQDPEPVSMGAWLRGIARNVVLRSRAPAEHLSITRRERILRLGGPLDYDMFDREALADCLARLSESERELLRLRYADDLRSGQIAERVRSAGDSVRARLHRIRMKLRRCLKKKGVFE